MLIYRRMILGCVATLAVILASPVASGAPPQRKESPTMNVQDVFALITTDKMQECRDFYVRHFGFEVAFESPIYMQLSLKSQNGTGFSLAFMPTKHPFGVVGAEPFNGQGLMLTIQVADSAAVYAKIIAEHANIIHELKTEAWGQRRFTMRDPAGVAVDVVQMDGIEAQPGYYEQFVAKPGVPD